MSSFVILGVGALLFLLAFVTKRRFGVLGLGLCAGTLLSESLTVYVATLLTDNGVEMVSVSSTALASCILIVLPSLILLFSGPKYTKRVPAIIGALLYTLMATLLVLGPLSSSLVTDATSRAILLQVSRFEQIALAVFVAVALIDTLFLHGPKLGKKGDEH
ncbi:hypothetical protein CYG49_04925 [Candidatus Saccharibacteria bacterium]|nr:MAG: hypothetical protein CYG49_04925 [Candidatus Saccharibacteria bacterium]